MTITCSRCYNRIETSEPNIAEGLAIAQGIAMAGAENVTVESLIELKKEVAGHNG